MGEKITGKKGKRFHLHFVTRRRESENNNKGEKKKPDTLYLRAVRGVKTRTQTQYKQLV